ICVMAERLAGSSSTLRMSSESFAMRQLPVTAGSLPPGCLCLCVTRRCHNGRTLLRGVDHRKQGRRAAFHQRLSFLDTHGEQNVCRLVLGAAMSEEASILAGLAGVVDRCRARVEFSRQDTVR